MRRTKYMVTDSGQIEALLHSSEREKVHDLLR